MDIDTLLQIVVGLTRSVGAQATCACQDSIAVVTGNVFTVQRVRILNLSDMQQCRFDQEMCVGAKLANICIHIYSLRHSCALQGY